MKNSISNTRFVNMPWLWVSDMESIVGIVLIQFTCQVIMKLYDIIHEPKGEGLHIRLALFSTREFLPRGQEVVQ